MATDAHKNLTGSDLHESKGVAAAAANLVYVTDGAGSGTHQKLTASQLTGTGNPYGAQFYYCRERKTSGLPGGTFTQGAWQTRAMNAERTNEIGATTGSSQVILLAGTYVVEASCPAYSVGKHMARLYNISDGSMILEGTSETAGDGIQSRSFVSGRFTLSATKTIELQHYCDSTQVSNGFGVGNGFGAFEYFSELKIWKVL